MESVDKCQHYGSFMSGLQRKQAEGLYWGFFSMVVLLLFACSWNYGRTMEKIEGLSTDNPRRQRLLRRGFWTAIAGGLVSCCFGIFAAFTLLTLQFCDEEPLASLYWSTWTVLVVGGIVAIFGISLHIRNLIKSRKLPPWALALGTPVLVVAGLGHYFQGKLSRKARLMVERVKNRSKENVDIDLSDSPTVRDNSIDSGPRTPPAQRRMHEDSPYMQLSNELTVKVLRVTDEGDVVIRIPPALRELSTKIQMSTTTLGQETLLASRLDFQKTPGTVWSEQFTPIRERRGSF